MQHFIIYFSLSGWLDGIENYCSQVRNAWWMLRSTQDRRQFVLSFFCILRPDVVCLCLGEASFGQSPIRAVGKRWLQALTTCCLRRIFALISTNSKYIASIVIRLDSYMLQAAIVSRHPEKIGKEKKHKKYRYERLYASKGAILLNGKTEEIATNERTYDE